MRQFSKLLLCQPCADGEGEPFPAYGFSERIRSRLFGSAGRASALPRPAFFSAHALRARKKPLSSTALLMSCIMSSNLPPEAIWASISFPAFSASPPIASAKNALTVDSAFLSISENHAPRSSSSHIALKFNSGIVYSLSLIFMIFPSLSSQIKLLLSRRLEARRSSCLLLR